MIYSAATRKLMDAARAAKSAERKAAKGRQQAAPRPDPNASTGVNGLRQRDPRELDGDYIAWLHTRPCTACVALRMQQKTPTEAAHPKFGIAGRRRVFGIGERSHDRYAVPLCSFHHRLDKTAEHNRGQRRFWDELGVDIEEHSEELCALYAAETGRSVK